MAKVQNEQMKSKVTAGTDFMLTSSENVCLKNATKSTFGAKQEPTQARDETATVYRIDLRLHHCISFFTLNLTSPD